MRRLPLLALMAALTSIAAPALATENDGFAAFWTRFAAAAGKDDKVALAALVQLGDGVGETSFATLHAQYLKPSERTCLAKAHPVHSVDGTGAVNYSAFCSHLVYVFTKTTAGWKLTDLSPDD